MNNTDTHWLGKEPVIEDAQIDETIETEVLIAGGGTGGLTAAASAAELGIKNTPDRDQKKLYADAEGDRGRRLADSEGRGRRHRYPGAGSPAGHVCVGLYRPKAPVIWARESGEMMDWYEKLITARGAKMFLQGGYQFEVKPGSYTKFPTGHNSTWPKGVDGVKVITGYAKALGAEFRMQTGLVKLLKDGRRVTGAVVKDMKTGCYIRVNASKGVIVATGGYANNKTMLKALQPETALMAGFTLSEGATKGDGIRSCLWAGAAMDDRHTSILFDRCAIMPDENARNTEETRPSDRIPRSAVSEGGSEGPPVHQ